MITTNRHLCITEIFSQAIANLVSRWHGGLHRGGPLLGVPHLKRLDNGKESNGPEAAKGGEEGEKEVVARLGLGVVRLDHHVLQREGGRGRGEGHCLPSCVLRGKFQQTCKRLHGWMELHFDL